MGSIVAEIADKIASAGGGERSELEVRGGVGAAGGGILTLSTSELSTVDGDILGRIDFQAPLDGAGSDAILVPASIWAEADATFSSTVNNTELVFATATGTAAAEKMRLTSDGKLLLPTGGDVVIGHSAGIQTNLGTHDLQVLGTNSVDCGILIGQFSDTSSTRPTLAFLKSNQDTIGNTLIADGQMLGEIQWLYADGVDYTSIAAKIRVVGSTGSSSYAENTASADMLFYTSLDTNSPAERMRIHNDGKVGIGVTAPASLLHVAGTVQVGVDDTGHDVKFFGATSGSYMLWDESTDDLILGGAARLGIGITLDAWSSGNYAMQFGLTGAIWSYQSGGIDSTYIGNNVYHNSGWKAILTAPAAKIQLKDDTMWFQNAPSASADAALSFVDRMCILANGNVGIGTATPEANLQLGQSSGGTLIFAGAASINAWYFSTATSNSMEISVTSGANRSLNLVNKGSANMDLALDGALSKGSGSFKIDHPLPSKTETHYLVHSFVESPRADLMYRDKVILVNGSAIINIDSIAGMTEGTFVLLCDDVQCFTSNESDWSAVKGSVSGNILTIECEDAGSTATIAWMVVADRKDEHMLKTGWTVENGKPIIEPLKNQPPEEEPE
jgi:hypothetical protein